MKRIISIFLLTASALWLTACSDGNTTSGVQEMSPPSGLVPPAVDLQANVLAKTQAGSLAVVSPNGNENWLTGYEYVIQWNPGTATGTIRIYLYKSSDQYLTIDDVANTGTYRWEIPSTIPAHSEYQVGVQSWTNADNYDFSNRYFTIQPGLASSSSVYSNYVSSYGDLLTAYNRTGGGQSVDSWGKWHWLNHGLAEGRSLSEISTSSSINTSSSGSSTFYYGDYVQTYPDLLASYNASGSSLAIGDWGRAHWTSYGSPEGRTFLPSGIIAYVGGNSTGDTTYASRTSGGGYRIGGAAAGLNDTYVVPTSGGSYRIGAAAAGLNDTYITPSITGGYRIGGAAAGLNDTYITPNATGGYSVGPMGGCGGLCTGGASYTSPYISLW